MHAIINKTAVQTAQVIVPGQLYIVWRSRKTSRISNLIDSRRDVRNLLRRFNPVFGGDNHAPDIRFIAHSHAWIDNVDIIGGRILVPRRSMPVEVNEPTNDAVAKDAFYILN